MSILIPDTGLLFWMLLSFGIVLFTLSKYGFPIIIKIINERKAFIDDSLKAAKQANECLNKIKEKEEKILKNIRYKRLLLIEEANEIRLKIINDAKKQANIESAKLIENTKKNIQKEQKVIMKNIQKQAIILSIDIAEKILCKKLDNKNEQLKLIDTLIKKLN